MESLDTNEVWRRVPPEEKFELLAAAQSKGVLAAVGTVAVCGAVATGLRLGELLWGGMVLAPVVFQYSTSKAWRGLRPRVMLEYLAARSAARRYAFAANGKELAVSFLFRGRLARPSPTEGSPAFDEPGGSAPPEKSVWVALFPDSLVVMSEGTRGATTEFCHLLDEKVSLAGRSPAGGGDYSDGRELVLTYANKRTGDIDTLVLTSRYPAALVVFEKRFQALHAEALRSAPPKAAVAGPEAADDDPWGLLAD